MPENWRDHLKRGDPLDCVRIEFAPRFLTGWITGVVVSLNSRNVLEISPDGMPAEANTESLLAVAPIAPYSMYTGGKEWRQQLSKGSLIDCMDSAGNWYRSTVIETSKHVIEGKNILMLKVGFRRFTSEGTKKDAEGRKYEGWNEAYDEVVNAFSLRVQRADSIGKIGKMSCKKEAEKTNVDDVSDVLLNGIEGIYAMARPGATPTTITSVINKFGVAGGFRNVLKVIKDRSCSYSRCLANC